MANNMDTIITIDGPSGGGKSTVSRMLAAALGYTYLDTGAMYRAVGLQARKQGVDLTDEKQMAAMLDKLDLQLSPGDGDTKVLLAGEDISAAIRSAEMGMVASAVSALPLVRQKLTEIQQQIGAKGRVVAEGRDMGTVVFPKARYKYFLDASAEVRARRRVDQLHEKGEAADYDDILAQIIKRDHDDSTRALAPLKPAADAVLVDSSRMNAQEVVNFILDQLAKK
ncbi:MAG: (d)CMP kinase [Proteobacteria bacterium]|nr:(d)CMP kinase [Pseudomonadota bacterium]MBU1640568.1 (d)CMP kinase [Pseudomonadota bacterium]